MNFNYAMRQRFIDFNPAEHVAKLRTVVSLEADPIDGNVYAPEEVALMIKAADAPRWDSNGRLVRNNIRLLIKIAAFTGMRSGEIRGLQ